MAYAFHVDTAYVLSVDIRDMSKRKPQISTAAAVVAKFGGLTGTARALSTKKKPFAVTTVQGWVDRGRIPQEHWQPLIEAARAADVDLSVSDFLPPGLVAA